MDISNRQKRKRREKSDLQSLLPACVHDNDLIRRESLALQGVKGSREVLGAVHGADDHAGFQAW